MGIERKILRGDIYIANLDPIAGSEQAGIRPVLVVSNNVGNHYSTTIIVVPITSRGTVKRRIPTHVKVDYPLLLKNGSIALTEQIRAIDTTRLKEYIGNLPGYLMKEVDKALSVAIDLKRADSILPAKDNFLNDISQGG